MTAPVLDAALHKHIHVYTHNVYMYTSTHVYLLN